MLDRIGIDFPILQAPMAGVSTPEMAAAVSEAGALGSIAVGATDAAGARAMIGEVRARTSRAFNVNLFVHREPLREKVQKAFSERPDQFRPLLPQRIAHLCLHIGTIGWIPSQGRRSRTSDGRSRTMSASACALRP